MKAAYIIVLCCCAHNHIVMRTIAEQEVWYWNFVPGRCDSSTDCTLIHERKCKNEKTSNYTEECLSGTIRREYWNCNQNTISPCPGEFEGKKQLDVCANDCDEFEVTEQKCSAKPNCKKLVYKTCDCDSQWSSWSQFGQCSKSCVKTATRYCVRSGTLSTKCRGANRTDRQTVDSPCNEGLCDVERIAPVRPQYMPMTPDMEAVDSRCGSCDQRVSSLNATEVLRLCDDSNLLNCKSNLSNYRITCGSELTCETLSKNQCIFNRQWSPWSTFYDEKILYRKLQCDSEMMSQCHADVSIERRCTEDQESHFCDNSLLCVTFVTFSVVMFLILCIVFGCCCYKMKIKKKKKKVHSPRIEHEHHLEAAPDSMLVNNAETSPRYALANSPKSPGPFRVVGQIMDHLYEVMSNKSPGLVSGASVSPMATQNEYTMDQSTVAPKTPLRNFSMTLKVTAPDGKETEPVLPRESDEPPSSTLTVNPLFDAHSFDYLTMKSTRKSKVKESYLGNTEDGARDLPMPRTSNPNKFRHNNLSTAPSHVRDSFCSFNSFDSEDGAPENSPLKNLPKCLLKVSPNRHYYPHSPNHDVTSFPGNDINDVDQHDVTGSYFNLTPKKCYDTISDAEGFLCLGEPPHPYFPDYDNCNLSPTFDSRRGSYAIPIPLPSHLADSSEDGLPKDKYGYLNINSIKRGQRSEQTFEYSTINAITAPGQKQNL